MPEWFNDLFIKASIAQSVIIVGLVIAIGIWIGHIKIAGISLGIICWSYYLLFRCRN